MYQILITIYREAHTMGGLSIAISQQALTFEERAIAEIAYHRMKKTSVKGRLIEKLYN